MFGRSPELAGSMDRVMSLFSKGGLEVVRQRDSLPKNFEILRPARRGSG